MTASPDAGIHRMPNELLGEVFIQHDAMFHGSKRTRPSFRLWAPFKWTRLMLVCKRWRDVAIATSTLWSFVHVEESRRIQLAAEDSGHVGTVTQEGLDDAMRWLHFALSRTAQAPLELLFTRMAFGEAALPTLIEEAFRIRTLALPGANPQDTSNQPFQALFRLALPALVELDVMYDSKETWERHLTVVWPQRHVDVSPPLFPSLRILRLSYWSLGGTSVDIFPQLTCLDLRLCAFQEHPASITNLLDILETCAFLNELRLELVLGTLTETTEPPRDRVVHLKKLQKLVVKDAPRLTHLFLSHVSVPEDASVRVVGVLATFMPNLRIDDVLQSLLPSNNITIPLLRSVTEGTVRCEDGLLALKFLRREPGRGETKLSLKILATYEQILDFLDECLQAMRSILPTPPLSTMEFDYEAAHTQVTEVRPWVDFLGQFATIEDLRLTARGPALGFVRALGCHVDPADDVLAQSDADSSRTPVCPRLRWLTIKDMEYQPGLVETLVGVLWKRGKHGLPKLYELKLALGAEDFEECQESFEMYEEEITSLVKKFEWGVEPDV